MRRLIMNDTVLAYTGKLILETKTRSVVKHNHGTTHLFRLLSTILCKDNFNTLSLPTYFMLYKTTPQEIVQSPDTSVNTSRALLRTYVDIVSQSSSENNVFESTFTSTIQSSMLTNTTPVEDGNLTLALISGDKRSILAAVEFSSSIYNIVCSGGQTFVKWVMSISNADDIAAKAIAELLEE